MRVLILSLFIALSMALPVAKDSITGVELLRGFLGEGQDTMSNELPPSDSEWDPGTRGLSERVQDLEMLQDDETSDLQSYGRLRKGYSGGGYSGGGYSRGGYTGGGGYSGIRRRRRRHATYYPRHVYHRHHRHHTLPPGVRESSDCFKLGVDYSGNDLGSRSGVASAEACQLLCKGNLACFFFTYHPTGYHARKCFLKTANGRASLVQDSNAVSGPRTCGAQYKQGAAGAECALGTRITSKDECLNTAVKSIGVTPGSSWVGSTTNIPVGCSIRNGGDLRPHWNTASTGRGRSDLRPICKAAGPTATMLCRAAYPQTLTWMKVGGKSIYTDTVEQCLEQVMKHCPQRKYFVHQSEKKNNCPSDCAALTGSGRWDGKCGDCASCGCVAAADIKTPCPTQQSGNWRNNCGGTNAWSCHRMDHTHTYSITGGAQGKKAHKPKKTRMAKMEMKFRRMTKEQFEKKKATIIEKMAKLMNIDASRLELKLTKPFVPSACKDNDSEVNRACDLNPQTCHVWKGEKIRTCSAAVAMARSRNVSCDLKMPTNVKLHEACCKSCSSPGQEEQLTELIDVSARNGYDSSIEAVIKDATPEEEAKAKEVLKGSDLNRELSQEDLNYEGGKLLSIVPESGAAALGVSLTAAFLIALVLIMK